MSTVTITLQKAAFTQSGKDLKVRCDIDVTRDPGDRDTPPYEEVCLTDAELVSGTVLDLIFYLNAEEKIADKANKELTDLHEWDKLERRIDAMRSDEY